MGSVELAGATTEVLGSSTRTLDELANAINRKHQTVGESIASAVDAAIGAGEDLEEANERVPRGQWQDWVAGHCACSLGTANAYRRLARNQRAVREARCSSITDALRLLDAGLIRPEIAERAEEARELRAGGLTYAQVGESLGVSVKTAYYWANPKAHQRAKARARKYTVTARTAIAHQAREREIKRALRKADGALTQLYADAERMQDVLGRAHAEATDSERRRALSLAGEYYRAMRDEIVRALGVS